MSTDNNNQPPADLVERAREVPLEESPLPLPTSSRAKAVVDFGNCGKESTCAASASRI